MKINKLSSFLLTALTVVFASCQTPEAEDTTTLSVRSVEGDKITSIAFEPEAQNATISVVSDASWKATTNASWVEISPVEFTNSSQAMQATPATVTVKENTSTTSRSAIVTFTYNGKKIDFTVSQKASTNINMNPISGVEFDFCGVYQDIPYWEAYISNGKQMIHMYINTHSQLFSSGVQSGIYTVSVETAKGNIDAGYLRDGQHYGSWLNNISGDKPTPLTPLTGGTISVDNKGGNKYALTLDLVEEGGDRIIGSFDDNADLFDISALGGDFALSGVSRAIATYIGLDNGVPYWQLILANANNALAMLVYTNSTSTSTGILSGTYQVSDTYALNTLAVGDTDGTQIFGSWFCILDGDDLYAISPVSGGSIEITNNGSDNYTISVNLTHTDSNYKITSSYEGAVNVSSVAKAPALAPAKPIAARSLR